MLIRLKDDFDCDGRRDELAELCGEEVADNVIKALKISMGQDIIETDMQNIDNFAAQVLRKQYLSKHNLHSDLIFVIILTPSIMISLMRTPKSCALMGDGAWKG